LVRGPTSWSGGSLKVRTHIDHVPATVKVHAAADRDTEIARRLSPTGRERRLPMIACVVQPRGGAGTYTQTMSESRVVADHRIMGGVPCIRGTRIPVATVIGLFAQRQSVEEVLADYPQLSAEDVRAALEFAAAAVSERQVPLRTPA
jgi:uncharacterized protein (DUF433 family)